VLLVLYNMIKVGNIGYNPLSFLLKFHADPTEGIPKASGIYHWVYWPRFDPKTISMTALEIKLKEFTKKSLLFSETIVGEYKFHAIISEQGYPTKNDTLFGLPDSKNLKLLKYLGDRGNLAFFSEFFQDVCFSRPFYIGKANNLNTRLVQQHFKGRSSNILAEITKNGIPFTDIWVGYKIIPDIAGDDINNIFEEIFSRRIKPGLTKKSN
jgi:hypothetical protein